MCACEREVCVGCISCGKQWDKMRNNRYVNLKRNAKQISIHSAWDIVGGLHSASACTQ